MKKRPKSCIQNLWLQDFPGGSVDKNLPANVGDMTLIPGPGRFHMPRRTKPYVPQPLGPTHPRALQATTTEPNLNNKRNHHNEKPAHGSKRAAFACPRKPVHSSKDRVQPKVKMNEGLEVISIKSL